MRPVTLIEAIKAVVPTGQTIFLWGAPGVGKSSIAKQVADQLYAAAYGCSVDADGRLRDKAGKFTNERPWFVDIRAVLLDPVDLRGLPTIGKDGRATWAVPDMLPDQKTKLPGMLFLDELPQSPPLTQGGLLQLTLDKALGEYRLPANWAIVAAGNRAEDRAGGHRMISALGSRFMHLDLDVSVEDWQSWAIGRGVRPEVRAFIASRPTLLHKFDGSAGARCFPCPRSWEFVSTILPAATDTTIFDLVKGCIGDGPAAEFVAFVKVYRSLPDVDAILASVASAPVPTEPDVLYAVTSAIGEKVRATASKGGAAAQYAGRLPKEFGVLLFRDLIKISPAILTTPAGKAFLQANRDALISA